MKLLSFIFFTIYTSYGISQINIEVSGNIFDSPSDSIYIYQYINNGKGIYHLGSKINEDGSFLIKGLLDKPDYYILKLNKNAETINVILRDSSNIKVYGDGKNLSKFINIVNSDESNNMQKHIVKFNAFINKRDSLQAIIKSDTSKLKEVSNIWEKELKKFKGINRGFISRNANSAALIAALSTINPGEDYSTYESIIKQLKIGFGDSPTIQKLVKEQEKVKTQRIANDKLAPGKLAPDFEELKTDRKTKMKLSDLRGQVVLLDFWASWCGPCRRENPTVVQLYEKYKENGFTVMSVSLDKDEIKWLQAIKKDNLSWLNHVSDLKGWSSNAAKEYGVSGIPFTILIDREGKIIAKNLKGQKLTNELARIFSK